MTYRVPGYDHKTDKNENFQSLRYINKINPRPWPIQIGVPTPDGFLAKKPMYQLYNTETNEVIASVWTNRDDAVIVQCILMNQYYPELVI